MLAARCDRDSFPSALSRVTPLFLTVRFAPDLNVFWVWKSCGEVVLTDKRPQPAIVIS